tara:strand:- start:60 stop:698 length:639 start_codon:yes stop_codon:yes gene_type:complete
MIALEKNGSLVHQGSWDKQFQLLTDLRGNAQPSLPFTCDAGTLRNITYDNPTLKAYQHLNGETGAVDGDYWKITPEVDDLSLTESKNKALAEIAQHRYESETAGIVSGDKYYSTDREAQNAIFRASGTSDWKCYSTVTRKIHGVDTTCCSEPEFVETDMDALKTAVEKHIADAYAKEKTLMTSIKNADDLDALRAIDLTSGWVSQLPHDPGE